jgi:two-component system response regulator HydG
VGAFEAAGAGTVLLDEIGELALTSQAKLLRVLEEKRFERIGSNRPIALKARVLAATNRDLARMVDARSFRSDLFFRIAVVSVRLPSLRDRGDDVLSLASRLLHELASDRVGPRASFSRAALDTIQQYAWPGNVRELRNAIEHALVVAEGPVLEPEDLPESVRCRVPASSDGESDVVRLPTSLASLEAHAIDAALRLTGGNQQRAAALLGINRVTLYRKLQRRGVLPPAGVPAPAREKRGREEALP